MAMPQRDETIEEIMSGIGEKLAPVFEHMV